MGFKDDRGHPRHIYMHSHPCCKENRRTDLLTRLRCYSFISAGGIRFLSSCKDNHIFINYQTLKVKFEYFAVVLLIIPGHTGSLCVLGHRGGFPRVRHQHLRNSCPVASQSIQDV